VPYAQDSLRASPQAALLVDRSVDITTGESVAFSYELAGLGSRFFAVIVDMTIQIAVLLLLVLALAWGISLSHPEARAMSGASVSLTREARVVLEAAAVAVTFVVFFGYFIVLEWRFDGRTPGKRLCGIRVVRDGGFALDFGSSVVRNLVRIVELAFGFYAISAISTLLSPRNRRLGDYAAATLVVREASYGPAAGFTGFTTEAALGDPLVGEVSGEQIALVRRYLARRETFTAEGRTAVAADVAGPIRPRLGASFEHLDDDALLVHLGRTVLRAD